MDKPIWIDQQIHTQIKAKAAIKGLAMRDYISELVQGDHVEL